MTPSAPRPALTPEALVAMKERCARATPGPWGFAEVKGHDGALHDCLMGAEKPTGHNIAKFATIRGAGVHDGAVVLGCYEAECRADAAFAASARTDLPAALALIADLLDVIAEQRTAIIDCLDRIDGPVKPHLPRRRVGSDYCTPAWRSVATSLRKGRT